MLSEPRTISLSADFVHVPMTHDAEKLREVYSKLCRLCGYENFTRVQGGARIEETSSEGKGTSNVTILRDRVQFLDNHTGVTVDQFGRKMRAALGVTLSGLGIPLLLVQQYKVRAISVPNSYKTSSEFLAHRIFRLAPGQLEPLGRPASFFGFRLLFPSASGQPEHFDVRIESYVHDASALYIENSGTFKAMVQPNALDAVEENLRKSSEFISENVVSFLSQYDGREPE